MDAVTSLAPDAWAASKEARAGVDGHWLKKLGGGRLATLIDEALRGNHDLKIAAARMEQARGDVKITASQGLPKLDAGFTPARRKQNFIGFPLGGPASGADSGQAAAGEPGPIANITNTFGLSLDVTWELDVWGRIRAGTSAATAALQAAELDFAAARISLSAQTAKAWFALIEARQQLALAGEALKTYQDTESALEERFKAGQAQETGGLGAQLRLARSDVASARAAMEQRREIASAAARQLELLLGKYPQGFGEGSEELPALGKSPPAGLPSELLQRRPDILAAERRFAAQGMRAKEARRAVFPRIALTAGGGTSTAELGDLLNSDFGVWTLAGKATQAILTGGQVAGEIRKRAAQEDESLAVLQKSVLKAFQEVEDALDSDGALARREAALADAAKLAAEADQEARADFRRGLGDLLTVLQTQQRALQAKSALISVKRQRLDNRVNLHLALGGDFTTH